MKSKFIVTVSQLSIMVLFFFNKEKKLENCCPSMDIIADTNWQLPDFYYVAQYLTQIPLLFL